MTLMMFTPLLITFKKWAYYKTRNAGTRKNGTRNIGGTAEHPGTVAEQRNTPEDQWNTPGCQRNTNIAPAEHPGTMEPYRTKSNCSIF